MRNAKLSVVVVATVLLCAACQSDDVGAVDANSTRTPGGGDASLRFEQISAGRSLTCGITTSGRVVCWGQSANGALLVPDGKFKQVSARGTPCGVRANGRVECWASVGGEPEGTFDQVATGGRRCGVRTDGSVKCWTGEWSRDNPGVIVSDAGGVGDTADAGGVGPAADGGGVIAPDGGLISASGTFQEVRTDYGEVCAIDSAGDVQCRNRGEKTTHPGPFVQLAIGGGDGPPTGCAVAADQTLECWNARTPLDGTHFKHVSTGGSYGSALCGVRTDGNLECKTSYSSSVASGVHKEIGRAHV